MPAVRLAQPALNTKPPRYLLLAAQTRRLQVRDKLALHRFQLANLDLEPLDLGAALLAVPAHVFDDTMRAREVVFVICDLRCSFAPRLVVFFAQRLIVVHHRVEHVELTVCLGEFVLHVRAVRVTVPRQQARERRCRRRRRRWRWRRGEVGKQRFLRLHAFKKHLCLHLHVL